MRVRPRAVLDTNVVISGLLFGGPPRQILQLALEGSVEWLISAEIEQELERVLNVKFPQHHEILRETMSAIQEIMIHVVPRQSVSIIREDPSDNRVLECALAARADVIVSGDRHLLSRVKFMRIPILSPQAFLSRWFPKKSRRIF